MRIYRLILLILEFLIKELEIRVIHNKELRSKYKESFEFSRDLPLFCDDNSEWELVIEEIILTHDTKECQEMLETIRIEYIIKTYFNSQYVEYTNNDFNPQ
jgi:hypothetical protein